MKWPGVTALMGGYDANGDRKPDLAHRRADGSLWFIGGTGMTDEGYIPRRAVGNL